MKVVCINNTNITPNIITVGETYDATEYNNYSYFVKTKSLKDKQMLFLKTHFIELKEYRRKRLEELLT